MSDAVIDNKTILKLCKNVLKRYEHNLKEGTMLLFDTETEEIWIGNSSSKNLIDLIDGQNNIEDIYSSFLTAYSDDFETAVSALNSIVEDLILKGFVEIINS